jgi:hypothetical protein
MTSLSRVVFYGGVPTPLGEVVADLQATAERRGLPPACVDRYLQGLLRGEVEYPSPLDF